MTYIGTSSCINLFSYRISIIQIFQELVFEFISYDDREYDDNNLLNFALCNRSLIIISMHNVSVRMLVMASNMHVHACPSWQDAYTGAYMHVMAGRMYVNACTWRWVAYTWTHARDSIASRVVVQSRTAPVTANITDRLLPRQYINTRLFSARVYFHHASIFSSRVYFHHASIFSTRVYF